MNDCPCCHAQMENEVRVCPECGGQIEAAAPSAPPLRRAQRPKIQCSVDLGVQVDRTGSSAEFQSGINLALQMILAALVKKVRSVNIWLASHGDLDTGQQFVVHTDSGTPEEALEDLKGVTFNGGGDPPESHLDGIEALLHRIPWTDDPGSSRGAIVAFLTADTKPAKSGITAMKLGEQIRDKGILFHLVCQPTPTLKELADAAEGFIYPITNSPNPDEMRRVADALGASITASLASGSGTTPMPG